MSSGWFDCTEPSLSTSLKGKQGVQGAYALVRGGSSTSNLLEPSRTTKIARCVEFCHMSSGRFEISLVLFSAAPDDGIYWGSSVKTRLVRDSSEVSATSGEPETVGSTRSSSAALRRKGLRPLYAHVTAERSRIGSRRA